MVANALQPIGSQGRIFKKSFLKCSGYRGKRYFYLVTKNKNMRHAMPAASKGKNENE